MIRVVACSCLGSEQLCRQVMRGAGLSDWAVIPVYMGKEQSLDAVSIFTGEHKTELLDLLRSSSSYAIAVGATSSTAPIHFVSFGDGSAKNIVEAQVLLSKFV